MRESGRGGTKREVSLLFSRLVVDEAHRVLVLDDPFDELSLGQALCKPRRRIRHGSVTGARVGSCRCAPRRRPGESLEDRQRACHHQASVGEDLSLGGFMARIVIKPNS